MKSSEQVLLRQFVLTNDAKAFAALSNWYASLVYGVCWRVLRDEHKAADAAQETFLQLLRHAYREVSKGTLVRDTPFLGIGTEGQAFYLGIYSLWG